MQMIYVVSFILMLVATIGSHSKDEAIRISAASDGLAQQLGAWHRAAHERCRSGCVPGTVDPRSMLPPALADLAAYDRGYFTTRYDPVSRLLVTHMTNAFHQTESVSFGTIAASMRKMIIEGHSIGAGIWNGSSVSPLHYYYNASVPVKPPYDVPVDFMGVSIPDGSPILVTRL